MIKSRVRADVEDRLDGSEPLVRRAVNEPRYARVDKRAGAHRARFDCRIHHGSGKTIISDAAGCIPQYHNLGVGGRVIVRDRPVPAGSDKNAVRIDQACTDRNLFTPGRGTRLEMRINMQPEESLGEPARAAKEPGKENS